jgi:zinc protease
MRRFIKPILLLAAFWSGSALAIPEIQHWQTENGARVYFVPAKELPMVDVRVVFNAGAARDGDKPGRALLTNAVLAEGAGELDADAIARRFDEVGANFSNDSLRDMAIASLRTLSQPELMDQALDTFALVLSEPKFPEEAIERERRRVLVALQNEKQSPDKIAEKAFYRAIYGKHPYAIPPIGTDESVRALTREDLLNHYRRYYVGSNAVVAIVGNLDRKGAERVAERVIGKLPTGEKAPPLPEVPALEKAQRITMEYPSAQTHIRMGQPGMKRGDKDYFPLYVGNHVLGGGGLVSRISEEIREKRGLAYSAYSYFSPMSALGPFAIGMQTANKNTGEALKVTRETLDDFVENGPTKEELEASKKNITGGFPLRIDSNSDIVQYLAVIGFYELPLDYLNTFNDNVEAVTVADVKEAFQRRIHPDRMVTVTVGAGGE